MIGEERLESKDRPIQPGDIMVLVRRRDRFVPALVRALKARRVPVSGIDRLRLPEDIAVMDLMAFADFLLMPEDDLTLAALLKSPLIGLSEEALFESAHRSRQGVGLGEPQRQARGVAGLPRRGRSARRYLGRADFHSPFALFADCSVRAAGASASIARLGPEADEPSTSSSTWPGL